jgi:hypothetical protein
MPSITKRFVPPPRDLSTCTVTFCREEAPAVSVQELACKRSAHLLF